MSKPLDQEQDTIGDWLFAEIDADRKWDELFASPSEVIERMADKALEDHRVGRTRLLDPETL
jgi:hypothetical protein